MWTIVKRSGQHGWWFAIAALTIVVGLQYSTGVFQSDFGGHGDEAAHFITTLMMRDFLASGHYTQPWAFAHDYYLHFPRVAIGHWPPVMYLTGAVWFALFGASRVAAMLFIATTAAATGTAIYLIARRLASPVAALLAASLYLISPLVLVASAAYMVEHLVTLLMLLSTMLFARFAATGRTRDGLAFGALAAVAILTRGSGWALGLVPAITIVLTRRFDLLRRPGLWLSAIPPLLVAGPWYYFTRAMITDTWEGSRPGVPYWQSAITEFGTAIYQGLGPAIILLAVIGLITKVVRPSLGAGVAPAWAALVGLAVGTFVLQCALPTGMEPRYMVTVIAPLLVLAAAGFDQSSAWLGRLVPTTASRTGLAAVLLAAFFALTFALPRDIYNAGYDRMVADVDARLGRAPQVWLTSAGTAGDGSVISAIAIRHPGPEGSIVVRGSKVLVNQDWFGRESRDLFPTLPKLQAVVDAIPASVIMIDNSVPANELRPYHARMRALVGSPDAGWTLAGTYPVARGGTVLRDGLDIYVRKAAGGRAAAPVDYARLNELISGNVVYARPR